MPLPLISASMFFINCRFSGRYLQIPVAKITLCDYLTRQFEQQINRFSFRAKGSGKAASMLCQPLRSGGSERTACEITDKDIIARFFIGFPANGRTINAPELKKILFDFLPICVQKAFLYKNLNAKKLEEAIFLAEDQAYIRKQLKKKVWLHLWQTACPSQRERNLLRPHEGLK